MTQQVFLLQFLSQALAKLKELNFTDYILKFFGHLCTLHHETQHTVRFVCIWTLTQFVSFRLLYVYIDTTDLKLRNDNSVLIQGVSQEYHINHLGITATFSEA